MKVVHLTSVHPPFDTRIFHRECATLAAEGFEVVLVGAEGEGGEVNGIRIRTVGRPRSRLARLTRTAWRIWRAALDEDGHLYHFHDPELVVVALLLKIGGKRVIYDAHEDLPRQILVKGWIPGMIRPALSRFVAAVEWVGAKAVDGVIAATPLIAERFPADRTVLVQNFPIPEELEPQGAAHYESRGAEFVYVGSLGRARGILEMIEAADRISDSIDLTLHIAGDFSSRLSDGSLLEQRERELYAMYSGDPGWRKVEHHGRIGRKELRDLLGRCRGGLVVLHPAPNYRDAWPVKLFEYMAAGLPVIAADFPLWRKIIESAGSGLLVDPLDPQAIADAMIQILDSPVQARIMGERGRAAVLDRYNWRTQAANLLSLYEDLLAAEVGGGHPRPEGH